MYINSETLHLESFSYISSSTLALSLCDFKQFKYEVKKLIFLFIDGQIKKTVRANKVLRQRRRKIYILLRNFKQL